MGKPAYRLPHVLAILYTTVALSADSEPITNWTPYAMIRVKQVGGVQVSPDGKRLRL
jgi:hypothetical protein